MPDRPDEADDGDGEEEDAAGGDASDDRERLHLVGSLAVGRDAYQDEAHQLWGISIFIARSLCCGVAFDAWNYTHDVANVEPYQGVLREVEVAAHGDADD